MRRRYFIAMLCCALVLPTGAIGSGSGGRGAGERPSSSERGTDRSRGGDDVPRSPGWGSTSPVAAREAVSQGWALSLTTVLPTVSKAVSGQVLEVDLRQIASGEWHYEFLVLTNDRRYQVVVVDARRNEIIQVRSR